jgi:fumarate reductase flavoprotein subunit
MRTNTLLTLRFTLSLLAIPLLTVGGLARAESFTNEVDVVVVGAGGAGLTTTLTAAEGGAKVILLEQNVFPGGTSLFAEGPFAVESSMQIREGYQLTKDDVFKFEMNETNWMINAPLLRAYINESDNTFDWLSAHGVPFKSVNNLPPDGFRTWHVIDGLGKELIRALYYKAKENPNVVIKMETPAKDLIFDDQHHVTGVIAQTKDGTELRIKAKAVVLATGGFGENPEMVKEYTGNNWAGPITAGHLHKVGFGIKMAQKAGAVLENMGAVQYFPFADMRVPLQQAFPSYAASIVLQPFNINVNKFGNRYSAEDIGFNFIKTGEALNRQVDKFAWCILDQSMVEMYTKNGPEGGVGVLIPARVPLPNLKEDMDKAIKAGNPNIASATSIEELAGKINVPVDTLKKTFANYNHYADTNYDPEFSKDRKYIRKLQGKLYAMKMVDFYLNTLGGARVNEHLQPLDANDQIIPHLYVVGTDAGGLYTNTYPLTMSGGSFGFAVNSGRLAGQDLLKSLKH